MSKGFGWQNILGIPNLNHHSNVNNTKIFTKCTKIFLYDSTEQWLKQEAAHNEMKHTFTNTHNYKQPS